MDLSEHKFIRLISLACISLLACCAGQNKLSSQPSISEADLNRLTAALDLKAPPIELPPSVKRGIIIKEVDPNVPKVDLLKRIDGTIEVEGSRYTDADALNAKLAEIKDRMPTPDFELLFEGGAGFSQMLIPAIRLLGNSCRSRAVPQRSICLSGPAK